MGPGLAIKEIPMKGTIAENVNESGSGSGSGRMRKRFPTSQTQDASEIG